MSLKDEILRAAKADAIPEGKSGLWFIEKHTFRKPAIGKRSDKFVEVPPGTYTYLRRLTTMSMYATPPGEPVMHDTPDELQTHLEFMLRARGHVLVTGLGLGCVARGLLANPAVRFVTVLEKSCDVMRLVYPWMPTKRIQIIRTDALRWVKKCRHPFDCAWHDLWSDHDAGDEHLQVMHSTLICSLAPAIRFQGAWDMPRWSKRLWNRSGELTIV